MPPELSDRHVAAICQVIVDHEVEFLIIGGVAARLHDTGHATIDIDICPSTDPANLWNLAAALKGLGARLRVEGGPAGVPFEPHRDMLSQVAMMTLITEHGPLDLCFSPSGFPAGYDSLNRHATTIVVGAVDVLVASLDDVVASKRAAGRPKGHRRTPTSRSSPGRHQRTHRSPDTGPERACA